MTQEEKNSLSKVRMERASECLEDARINLENNRYKTAANRSYYAAFHAMRAVLAMEGLDFKRHSGVISEFRRRYIKSGLLSITISKYIDELFEIRTNSDYNDFFIVSNDTVIRQVQNAASIIQEIGQYLEGIWKGENEQKRILINTTESSDQKQEG